MFANVLKKFFTAAIRCENNSATFMEDAMKDAMKMLIAQPPRGAMEDVAGLAALFVLLIAVLAFPGLA